VHHHAAVRRAARGRQVDQAVRGPLLLTVPAHPCLWLDEAGPPAEAEPAAPPLPPGARDRADVCIVGGGYTGLWTALRVLELEPSARVVLLEAGRCGEAASGRNGGFALSWWSKLPTLVKRVGAEEALRLARASEAAIGELEAFCARHAVDAGFRRGGWLWTATSEAQRGAWDEALRACERLGARPFEPAAAGSGAGAGVLGPAAAGTGTRAGVFEPAAATVQPALLARGLRRVAIERGVAVHERSRVMGVDRERGVVHASGGGSVRAGAVVLAANAWLAGVPELRRAIAVVSSDVVATEPAGIELREAISDSRLMVRYWRSTADGRAVLGRGGGGLAYGARGLARMHDPPPARTNGVADELPLLVPAARGVPVSHAWGGAVDRSIDGLPFFGLLPGRARVAYGAGFSGNGVAPSLVGARVLASLALGRDDEWTGCGLARGVPAGRFPPEPLRFLGGALVRRAVGRRERLESAGRRADPASRALASLAPRGR
jgi:glycine/D-amino acid oxidase-like deaminating enzyme